MLRVGGICKGRGFCSYGWGTEAADSWPESGTKVERERDWCELRRLSGAAFIALVRRWEQDEAWATAWASAEGGGEVVGCGCLGGAGQRAAVREGVELAATSSLEQPGRWRRNCLGRGRNEGEGEAVAGSPTGVRPRGGEGVMGWGRRRMGVGLGLAPF